MLNGDIRHVEFLRYEEYILQKLRSPLRWSKTKDIDRSLFWEEQASNTTEQGGFPCSVSSEQTINIPSLQSEIKSAEYIFPAIRKVKIGDCDHTKKMRCTIVIIH